MHAQNSQLPANINTMRTTISIVDGKQYSKEDYMCSKLQFNCLLTLNYMCKRNHRHTPNLPKYKKTVEKVALFKCLKITCF